jgi:hypothetical protein
MHQDFSTGRTLLSCAIALCFVLYQPLTHAQDPTPEPPAAEVPPAANGETKTPVKELTKPEVTGLKPFKEVIKGATQNKGFFTLYQKDEKVWLEIKPEQFDKPFFFSVNVTNSVGEAGLNGSWMWGNDIGVFHRIGNHVQLIAKNTFYTAANGTPQALALHQGFSDSLLASATVLSSPDPDGKGVLIDASALLFADIPGYSTRLDNVTHMGYGFDSRNSNFADTHADENQTGLHVNAHYFVAKIPAAPLVAATSPIPIPHPVPIMTTPDPRSFFVGFYYTFSALPEKIMHARKADDRIGHFVASHFDFTDDTALKNTQHFVQRWRLEKREPGAPLSEPVQPIVYWLDKNIPEKYRKSISDGILEWNKAFERIGFKDAIVVKQQTDKDDFDSIDGRHASIRWYLAQDAGMAIGPRQFDPRSGEIIGAAIAMSDIFGREARRFMREEWSSAPVADGMSSAMPGLMSNPMANATAQPFASDEQTACSYAEDGENEFAFAADLLSLRNDVDEDSPQGEALAQAYVKAVIMHEVGHTLGLRHNFRASTIYSLKQLQDPEFTKKNGLAGSVMDYIPFNLAIKGETQGEYVMSTLGPYDYWAIEYAYKPLDEKSEDAELAKIASRSTEPQLAFATDEDVSGGVSDPQVNVFDLGDDSLEYFKKSVKLSHELWDRVQTRRLKPGETYDSLRHGLAHGFYYLSVAMPDALKYIGGTTVLRDHAGSGRVPFTPVPAARQREALALVTASVFKSDSFKFSPELMSRISYDRLDWGSDPDVSIERNVLILQTSVLNYLMSNIVAERLLRASEKVDDPKKVLTLGELYDTVQNAVWSELGGAQEITRERRNLQREHLMFVINALVRSAPGVSADARSLQRQNAVQLQAKIHAALAHISNRESKAHLEECMEALNQALHAPMQRTGV